MITLSAFADEIDPDLTVQMDTCAAQGLRHIDVRGIDGTNVSQMTLEQVRQYRRRLDDRGFVVPCIGSPIGKIKISDDFEAHKDLLKHTCDVARAFGTDRIRVFSFYPSDGTDIAEQRAEVLDRMNACIEIAGAAGCRLFHENEKRIYGARPDGVRDLFDALGTSRISGIFDPANYVEEGLRPYEDAWQEGLSERTHYFHIKDKVPGGDACVPAGQGHGQIDRIAADLAARNWSGVMTLEPHLGQAGQFSGYTGPQRFAEAVSALRGLCETAGLPIAAGP